MTTASPTAPPPASLPPTLTVDRPKRRWWLYVAVVLGGLALLAVALVAALLTYWHSLVRTYTTLEAAPLPAITGSDQDLTAFLVRWAAFQDAVVGGTATEPFRASAADLNLLIGQNPDLRDRVRLVITNNQLLGQFSFALAQVQQPELRNRFVNGLARLELDFREGWLTVSVAELSANGRLVPWWVMKRVRQENLVKDLDKNPDTVEFLHRLAAIEVEDDHIVLKPAARN